METDPNITYKLAFADLREKLGRLPTANECLGIHDAYKSSYAREAVEREGAKRATAVGLVDRPRGEPLSGPDKSAGGEAAASEPERSADKPEPSERVIARGASGGILAVCRACGRDFERPVSKGRPPAKCGECR